MRTSLFSGRIAVPCLNVDCFKEKGNDTIIYCFCADLETVKSVVVNPEVETPPTHLLEQAMDVCCFEDARSNIIIYCFYVDP